MLLMLYMYRIGTVQYMYHVVCCRYPLYLVSTDYVMSSVLVINFLFVTSDMVKSALRLLVLLSRNRCTALIGDLNYTPVPTHLYLIKDRMVQYMHANHTVYSVYLVISNTT